MRKALRRPLLVLALVAALTAAVAIPAGASWGRVTISGDATPNISQECVDLYQAADAVGAIELNDGELRGCLMFFPKHFQCDELNGFARVRERGTEKFVGTYNGEAGEFKTRYTLEATFETGFCTSLDYSTQLTGGCDHYIRGTSGVFERARGKITFHDVIDPGNGASNFLYSGWLRAPNA